MKTTLPLFGDLASIYSVPTALADVGFAVEWYFFEGQSAYADAIKFMAGGPPEGFVLFGVKCVDGPPEAEFAAVYYVKPQAPLARIVLLSLSSPSDVDVLGDLAEEWARARLLFPKNERTFAALIEEVGEVGRALAEEHERPELVKECLQVATMALRLATEGDANHPSSLPATDGSPA